MAIGTIAGIASIAAAAASLSAMGYQAAQGAPKIPSGAAASRQISEAQAAALPTQRALSAAEQMGTAYQSTTGTMTRQEINAKIKELGQAYKASGKSDAVIAGQIATLKQLRNTTPTTAGANHGLDQFTIYKDQQGNFIPKELGTANFTGYGTADVEGKLARQMADIQTELGAKYGTQFAEEARREAELADPQGTAARKMEYDLIQKQLNNPPPINPLSGTLESQIDQQLKAGSGLDPMSRDLLDQAVARANADRAGQTSSGDIAQSMSTGYEGEARRQAAIQKAGAFLSSGTSPADIQYRREQQNLANLSNFVGGRTPESQFGSISGQGATPFVQGQQAPTMPGGASQLGQNYSMAAYQARTQQASQPNPWLAGISSILGSISTAGKAFA